MGIWRPQLGKWRDFAERESLLLFAQAIVELLFHHTADSFRARALNLHTLVRECLGAAQSVTNGSVPAGAMTPLLEELVHRLGTTSVFGPSRPAFLAEYQARLGDKKNQDSRELGLTLAALKAELEGAYWSAICSSIRDEVSSCRTTHRLIDLADAFISEAEFRGWDRQTIFSKTKWFFFTSKFEPAQINGLQALDDFIAMFDGFVERDLVCIFRASVEMDDAKQSLSKAKIDLLETAPITVPSDDRSREFLADNESLPRYVVIKAKNRDEVVARKNAEYGLQFIVNIHRFQHHDYRPKWSDSALVYDAVSMQRYMIKQPNSPMMVGNATRTALAKVSADDLIKIFMESRLSTVSSSSLFSLLEYHRAAIDSPTPENQLLSLWAGIEGMMPAPFGDKARVLHFMDLLIPSLTLTYVEQHVRYLVESYSVFDGAVLELVRAGGVGDSDFEKCASVLCCSELSQVRADLILFLRDSPLLRLRTESVIAKVSSPSALKKSLERRRLWICWQIQRIYSTRNRIVHNAKASPYLHAVVENLHSYFDAVVCAVIEFALTRGERNAVGAILQALKMHELAYLKGLASSDPFSVHSFKSVLFGHDSPLSPK